MGLASTRGGWPARRTRPIRTCPRCARCSSPDRCCRPSAPRWGCTSRRTRGGVRRTSDRSKSARRARCRGRRNVPTYLPHISSYLPYVLPYLPHISRISPAYLPRIPPYVSPHISPRISAYLPTPPHVSPHISPSVAAGLCRQDDRCCHHSRCRRWPRCLCRPRRRCDGSGARAERRQRRRNRRFAGGVDRGDGAGASGSQANSGEELARPRAAVGRRKGGWGG